MKKYRKSNFSYNTVPIIKRSRSSFPVSYSMKLSAKIGKLIPFSWEEVYPGDTWNITDTFVCRTSNEYLKPVMDNAFVDFHYFFVPYRTVCDDFTKVITGSNGDGEPNDWEEEFTGFVPCIPKNSTILPNTVGDALGLPVNMKLGRDVSILPFRAFAKIYNEWYRDENSIESTYIQKGAYNATAEMPNNQPWSVDNYTGQLPNVAKFRDIFTSALPKPQKGEAVELGLSSFMGNTPVVAQAEPHNLSQASMQFLAQGGIYDTYAAWLDKGDNGNHYLEARTSTGADGDIATVPLLPQNLYALTDGMPVVATNVNDLRMAFALQRIKERSARGGSRYTEAILSSFGVLSPDQTLQRSEYLGGKRCPLGYQQTVQTSASTESSPLGNVAAYGLSGGRQGFKKAFTEYGIVMCCMSIRYRHTYQQGIAPKWTRKSRFDFYDPAFMSVGEQPIYKTELYGSANEDEIFGYKGAWDELRSFPSTVSMQMRSGVENTLDIFHFADYYSSAPFIGKEFIEENAAFMERTLSVSQDVQDPFIFDIYRSGKVVRVLSSYSVPSLIDHH